MPNNNSIYNLKRKQTLLSRIHVDGWLLLGILALLLTGLGTVYSASGGEIQVAKQHGLRILIALGLMFAVAQIPPRKLLLIGPWIFSAVFLMLIAVLLIGDIGKGAQRWIDLGFFRFQPSEAMKLALPMTVAWLFAYTEFSASPMRYLVGLVLTFASAALIVVQPDLGTSIFIALSGLFVLFFAGLAWRLILAAVGAVAIAAPIAWNFLHAYQKQRVMTFLNPESDPLGSGYHIIQSKIAIGSGGLEGKGYLGSTQAHLDFLPESTTDFIFSVFAEEFGLIGVAVLFSLYLFVLGRGLYIAYKATDNFSRLLAASLTMTVFTYVSINIGMVSGVFPVVGLPLPLISYGGSSMLTLMIGFGILMSIHTHKSFLREN